MNYVIIGNINSCILIYVYDHMYLNITGNFSMMTNLLVQNSFRLGYENLLKKAIISLVI